MDNFNSIKMSLHAIYDFLDEVERFIDIPNELKGTSLRDLFAIELHSYFMYLAAADGKILPCERDFMNQLFDVNLSVQDYVRFINENDIYSLDFEDRMPYVIRCVALYDAKMAIIASNSGKSVESFGPKLVSFYFEAGKEFIACDGEVHPQEVEDLKTYCTKLAEGAAALLRNEYDLDNSPVDDEIGFIGGKKGKTDRVDEHNTSEMFQNLTTYRESIYKVGVDIPAGRYKLFVDFGRGYYAVCRDPNCDDIIVNDNFDRQAYIDIHNGQYVELERCVAIPLDEAPLFDGTVYTSGEYIVGQEIPAGEYKLIADEGCSAYYALEKFESDGSRYIISNDNFSNAAYVQTREGQILVLVQCTLTR